MSVRHSHDFVFGGPTRAVVGSGDDDEDEDGDGDGEDKDEDGDEKEDPFLHGEGNAAGSSVFIKRGRAVQKADGVERANGKDRRARTML